MNTTEETVFIVCSVSGTERHLVDTACTAMASFTRPSYVSSVVVSPRVFRIPNGTGAGRALGADLFDELQRCVGAIVFVDDLRPNVAYELGVFHGQGRFVLLVTTRQAPSDVWRSISDLAGCALLDVTQRDLTAGIHDYLRALYEHLSRSDILRTATVPSSSRNMVDALLRRPRIPVTAQVAQYGPSVVIDTWGGIIFDLEWDLLAEASFTLALRARDLSSTYSICFWVEYVDVFGHLKQMAIAVTSNGTRIGIESNERSVPAQGLSEDWRLLTGSFIGLLRQGHVMNAAQLRRIRFVRMRAGTYRPDPFEKVPAWELGFFEITGRG